VSSYTPVAADAYRYHLRACVSSYYYYISVDMLLYCYCCMCVVLLYMCPHTAVCFLVLLHMCPHDAVCVLVLLYMCPHTHTCVTETGSTGQGHHSAHSSRIHTSYATYAYLIRCACRQGPRQAANLKVHLDAFEDIEEAVRKMPPVYSLYFLSWYKKYKY
jgi:hypothetical protein